MAATTVPTEAPPVPPMAYSTTNASDASTTEIPAAMPAATTTPRSWSPGSDPAQQQEDRVAAAGGDQGHVDDVEAEGAEAAVGEQQALDDQDHGDAQRARPGADQDRGQDAAEQVAAGAAGHREVEHLHGEDEGGDQPGQRRLALLERAGRPGAG